MPEQTPQPPLVDQPTRRTGPAGPGPAPPPSPPRHRPRLKKLRLALILAGLGALALISTVFGMLMAVASDLPALDTRVEYRAARNSVLLADDGKCPRIGDGCTQVAKLTGNENRILLSDAEISPNVRNAVIAVEDARFYEHEGVDYKGIARALFQDLLRQRAAQGGSTITQQFVKNALSAQGNRSVFQKLREAALAYHLERKWSKQKILTQYLNSVYFGHGAYGVESAARTYFGGGRAAAGVTDSGAGSAPLASDLTPAQSALLAGMISSPSLYDPIENPSRAKERRDLVLERMLDQRMLTQGEYDEAVATPIPDRNDIQPPRQSSEDPYFSSWLTEQLVSRYRPGLVFGGGLKIKTTIDQPLQEAAEEAVSDRLTGVGPEAAVVAIENRTGEIKAMVGGSSFERRPFNLATNGHRQPGSAFKPFTLIAALEQGVSPDAVFTSQPKVFPVPGSTQEKFVVHNYSDSYAGVASLRSATATSDNSVYAELGLRVGTRRIARVAREMGVRTPISTNPSMTLGGLEHGLSPLELAYAYSTIANKGLKVSGTLAPGRDGPVGIERVEGSGIKDANERRTERVFDATIGDTAQQLLAGVISGGTGKAAAIGEFAAGKTGTTENYGDAWFVGFNDELTVAVWVGYPDGLKPMETEFGGSPVAGGTYPVEIWHDVLTAWIRIRQERAAAKGEQDEPSGGSTLPMPASPVIPSGPQSGLPASPTPGTQSGQPAQTAPVQPSVPVQPQATPAQPQATPVQPSVPQAPTPAPTPTPQAPAAPQGQTGSPTQSPSSGGAAGAPSG